MLRVKSPLDEATELVMHECIGCAIAVHRVLGPGYLESIYRRALKLELVAQGLSINEERAVHVVYRDRVVGKQKIDLVVQDLVILEIKTVDRFHDVHVSQLTHIFTASGCGPDC